jgi:membrane-bound lytic murein transglycosylase D
MKFAHAHLAPVTLWLVLATSLHGCIATPNPDPDTTAPTQSDGLVAAIPPSLQEPVAALRASDAEVAADTEIPTDPTLWSELRRGFALEHAPDHAAAREALSWLADQPDLLERIQPGAARYLAYLVESVGERSMPTEIALLPIIESTLDPYAFSSGGAAGLWQLIPATARHYGVRMNWWYDGRRDLIDSTDAALDHLQHLHRRFDDWPLAMAAYNAGESRVYRALRRSPDASFWELELPGETRRYVPRVLALARVIEDPALLGLRLPALSSRSNFVVQEFDAQIDLGTFARLADLPIDEIFRFNPGLNRGATPPDGPHRLIVAAQHATTVSVAAHSYPDDAIGWTRYVIREGDNLGSIAQRHNTSVAAIKASNSLSGHLIRSGAALMIPTNRVNASQVPENPLLARRGADYRVAPGDSLWTISRRYATSVDALVRANRLDPRRPLRVGQTLRVPGKSADRKIRYKVRPGDSLARIAARYGVKVRDIARWNRLDVATYLQPGQRLVLYVSITGSYL